MELVLDLHLHSRFSRAVSPRMNLQNMYMWGRKKGINILSVADFTHPLWFREARSLLEEFQPGIYKLKDQDKLDSQLGQLGTTPHIGPYFMLSAEVSAIYTERGVSHRIHNLIFAPNFETAEKINKALQDRGINLSADGRPILGMSTKDLAELLFSINNKTTIIPAHCLKPDSLIHTSQGMKSIQSITVGEKVYTHKNRKCKVTEVFKNLYEGKTYNIKPWYFSLGLETTPEHRYYAYKVKTCAVKGGRCIPSASHKKICKEKLYESYSPEWIEARKLEVGDILVYPRFKNTTPLVSIPFDSLNSYRLKDKKVHTGGTRGHIFPEHVLVTKELCRLIGYYLAEGYTNGRDEIAFAFHEEENEYVDDVIHLFQTAFGITHHRKYTRVATKGVEISFYSKLLVHFFHQHFYTNPPFRATTKTLPDWALHLPEELQAEVLRGWWRGDKGYSSSVQLMNAMKIIFLRLGIIPSISKDTKEKHFNRGNHTYEYRTITASSDLYHFSHLAFFEDTYNLQLDPSFASSIRKLTRRHGWIDKEYVYLPIRDISKDNYKGEVYNLEVEADNSYVSESATIHNCWTPWFSLYGSRSGYDHIADCFGEFAPRIFAIETGLSSDPSMNWRIKELDTRSVVSFSDAHSLEKMGREATVLKTKDKKPIASNQITYDNILNGLVKGKERVFQLAYTIEFYPEEGKYHYTGHRNCKVSYTPTETPENDICPVCHRTLTVGVMKRVEDLASRTEQNFTYEKDTHGVVWVKDPNGVHPPSVNLVPLLEILGEVLHAAPNSQKVLIMFDSLVAKFGSEHEILLRTSLDDIRAAVGNDIASAIERVRVRDITIIPGFDGEYGKVSIEKKSDNVDTKGEEKKQEDQLGFGI